MPNVGILNLQINDNSEKAVSGLNHLADALTRVRQAIGSGLKLNGVASGVEKLAKAIKTNMTDDVIDRIGRLTTELSKLQGLGNINIKISGASIESIREAVESTRESIGTINTGFEEIEGAATRAGNGVESFNQRMRETQSLVQNMGWTGGVNQFQQMFEAWDRLRSSMALGPGQATGGSTGQETGWTVWKNGAIEVEGTVSDASEHIAGYLNEPIQYLTGIGSQLGDIREYITNADDEMMKFARDTSAMSSGENAIIPYGADGSDKIVTELAEIKEQADATRVSVERLNEEYYDYDPNSFAANPHNYSLNGWGNTPPASMSAVEDFSGESLSYVDDLVSRTSQIELLEMKIDSIRDKLMVSLTSETTTGKQIADMVEQLQKLSEQADRLRIVDDVREKILQLKDAAGGATPSIQQLGEAMEQSGHGMQGMQTVDKYMDMSKIDLMTMKLYGMKYALAQDIEAHRLDNAQIADKVAKIQKLSADIEEAKNKTEEETESTHRLSSAFETLKDRIKNLGINKLAGQFARLVKYRMLRAVIKQIADGFREGVQNVYEYSNAIGSSFAPAMDSATSALAQMKNSIGAAAAPLIQSLIPILQTVVNWVITAVNYLNQFIALMRGQATWTKAVPQTEKAFEGQTKAAKGASAALKDLLADWDELNIIQSEAGGGGGGGSGVDGDAYKSMFEEIGVFDSKIKSMTDSLKDNLDDVKRIAEGVGAAILAWKLSKAFTGTLSSVMQVMAAAAIIDTSWHITAFLNEEYIKTKDEGYLIKDLAQTMVGGAAAGLIVWKATGGIWTGLLTVGLDLTASAGITYETSQKQPDGDMKQALQTLAGVKAAIGIAALALGFGIAAGSPFGAAVGAISGGVIMTLSAKIAAEVEWYKSEGEIAKEAFAASGKGGISVESLFAALQKEFDEASKGYSLVIDAFSGAEELKTSIDESLPRIVELSNTIKNGGGLTQQEAEEFKTIWQTVFDAFKDLTSKSFDTVFAGLNKSLISENETIREQARELRVSVMMMQNNLTEAMSNFMVEQNELADKISTGKATKEETEKYFTNLEAMTKAGNTASNELADVLAEGRTIDFGNAEEAIGNATQFVKDVQASSTAAVEEIEAGYKTEMEAVRNLRTVVELMYSTGNINEDKYNEYIDIFDQTEQNLKDAADKEKDKIAQDIQDAYRMVFEQAVNSAIGMTDLFNADSGVIDVRVLKKFLDEVIYPIKKVLEEAGYEIPEEFKAMFGDDYWSFLLAGESATVPLYDYLSQLFFGENYGEHTFKDWTEEDLIWDLGNAISGGGGGVRPSQRNDGFSGATRSFGPVNEGIAEIVNAAEAEDYSITVALEPDFEISDDYSITDALEDNFEVTEGYSVTVPVETEFIVPDMDDNDMHIWDQTGDYIDELTKRLFDATTLEEQRAALEEALSQTDVDGAYDILEAMKELGYDLNLFDDVFATKIGWGGIRNDMTLTASAAEDMAGRVRQAMASLDGISWTMDVPGGTPVFGGFHVVIPQIGMAATGGFVRSGDLIMANENGNIEMMGNMGGKSVVANNQQIVDGISHGVTNANENVVSELRSLTVLMQRMLNKEFVARAVPSSAWGRSNEQSADAFGRVTG